MAAVTGKLLTPVISLNSNPRLTPSSYYVRGGASLPTYANGSLASMTIISVATTTVSGTSSQPNIILPYKDPVRNTHYILGNVNTRKLLHRVYMPRQVPTPEGTSASVTVDSYLASLFTMTSMSRSLVHNVNSYINDINTSTVIIKNTTLVNEMYMNGVLADVIRFLSAERIVHSHHDLISASNNTIVLQTLTSNSFLEPILTANIYNSKKQVILDAYINNIQTASYNVFSSIAVVNAYLNEITTRTGYGNSVVEYLLSELSELSGQLAAHAVSYKIVNSVVDLLLSNLSQLRTQHISLNSYISGYASQLSTIRQSIITNQAYTGSIEYKVLRQAEAIRRVENNVSPIYNTLTNSKTIQTIATLQLRQIIHELMVSGISQRISNSFVRPIVSQYSRTGQAIRLTDGELFNIFSSTHPMVIGNRLFDLYLDEFIHELDTWVPPNLRKRLFIYDDILSNRISTSQAVPVQVTALLQTREVRNMVQSFMGITLGPLLHDRIEVNELKDYQLGNSIRFTATFKNWNGVLTDPISVSFRITGTGDVVIFETVVTADNRLSPGLYFIDYVPTAVGNFTYKWSAVIDDSPAVKMGDFAIKKKIT